MRNARVVWIAGATLVVIAAFSIVYPAVSPYGPNAVDLLQKFRPPSAQHWLGTDELGRDVATRIAVGGRLSLLIGVTAAAVAIVLGTVVGVASGYGHPAVDAVLMRIVDGLLSIPAIFLLLLMVAFFSPSAATIILALGFTRWMPISRLVRSEVLRAREYPFVEAARATGAPALRIVLRHLIPNAMPIVIVSATLQVAAAILAESALSYLGLGIQPPDATWGNMLSNSQSYVWQDAWLALYPGLFILATVLSINTLGDYLRDALDPHLVTRSRGGAPAQTKGRSAA